MLEGVSRSVHELKPIFFFLFLDFDLSLRVLFVILPDSYFREYKLCLNLIKNLTENSFLRHPSSSFSKENTPNDVQLFSLLSSPSRTLSRRLFQELNPI